VSRETEACDWCPKPATKRIEDVRGYETAVACDGCVKYGIRYVLPIGDPRCGDRHDEDGEGGVNVPRGSGPDPKTPGEARVPGGSDDHLPAENHPDDSAGFEHVIPLTKISGIPSNGILLYDLVPLEWPSDEYKPLRNTLAGSRADEGSTS
jgi:hypothetical protein